MRAARIGTVGLVLLIAGITRHLEAQTPIPVTDATNVALRAWIDAVNAHEPGRADEPVIAVAALSYDARQELNAGMRMFLSALHQRNYLTNGNPAATAIAGIAKLASQPDASSFLKRAAVFHADVAAYGDRFPIPGSSAATAVRPSPPMQRSLARDDPLPPLLTTGRVILNHDGQVLGEVTASWSWPFARSLLESPDTNGALALETMGIDRGRERLTDPFVASWYRATIAYMFASGAYGDLTPHLQHAFDVLPEDAGVLFDRGCFAELLGLPMHQALLSEQDLADQRGRRIGNAPLRWTGIGSELSRRIPPAETTNAEAERWFRRALALDPAHTEARVRLARLLDLRRRHQEAAELADSALKSNPEGPVAFFAHLFAGRIAQNLRQLDDASSHYRDAGALFPEAQSALLAASQLALLESNVALAVAPIERLSASAGSDPWWDYHLCSGRDANDLLRAVWRSVPR